MRDSLIGVVFWDEFWGIYQRDESLWSWLGALDPVTRKLALFFAFFAFVDLASASLLGIALRVAAGRLARRDLDAARLKSYRTVLSQAEYDHHAIEADLPLLASL